MIVINNRLQRLGLDIGQVGNYRHNIIVLKEYSHKTSLEI